MASSNPLNIEVTIVEVEELLQRLENVILQQSIGRSGNFEELVNRHHIRLSKKDERARNAVLKARQALSQRRKSIVAQRKHAENFTNIKNNTADDRIIQEARGPFQLAISNKNVADREAAEQLGKAKTLLNRATEARINSFTRQTEATIHRHPEESAEQAQHEQGPVQDQGQDHDHDQDQEQDHDQNQDQDQDQDQGSEHDHDQDQDQGPEHDQDQDSGHDQDESQGQDHGPEQAQPDQIPEPQHNAPLTTWQNLESESISLAIASLAVGVEKAGGLVVGVASDLLQQMARYNPQHGQICLHNTDKFIIPTLLSDVLPPMDGESNSTRVTRSNNRQNWVGGIGHWVLAIAQKTNATVGIQISNSLSHDPSIRSIISEVVTRIVRNSGWMADVIPIFSGEREIEVAQQAPGTNTCGVHVILNGWAYLLNITPCADWQPTLGQYDEALELVNGALNGMVTAIDIEAWPFQTKFTRSRTKKPRAYTADGVDRIMSAKTQPMSVDLYGQYLEGRRNVRNHGSGSKRAVQKTAISC